MDFEALFADVYPSLFRYCHRLTGDADVAEDLAQEAFVRLFERKVSGEPQGLRVWLFKVATNLGRDRARIGVGRRRLLEANPVLPSGGTSPGAGVERAQEIAAVRDALDTLDARDREMLLMREEGFSYREIAELVGVAATSVGTLLARAQRRFAEVYRSRYGAGDASG
ncbi:MAG: sigma-70 family RNA polymerase sigma factor [Gemmatimonadetes bacterium]|nr:sigma-70 family RNA polymerase sigma factor [Gemmatimonadota bacterium]